MRFSAIPAMLLLLGAAVVLAANPAALSKDSSVRDFMGAFSERFRRLESAIEGSDVESCRQSAAELAEFARIAQIAGLPDKVSEGAAARRFVQRVRELASELATSDEPAPVLAELRASCVQCHGRYRPSVRCQYPSTMGLVTGKVQLQNAEGETREEHGDVVVFLESPDLPTTWPMPRTIPAIYQKNRQFSPRVLPVVVGTTVKFPNDDSILHNVFSLSKAKNFDLEIFRPGDSGSVKFDRPGLIRVYCNIHPDMNSSVLVLENPYFTVSDSDGRFVIPEVPEGEYTLRIWSSLGADSRQTIDVDKFANVSIEIVARETKRTVKHHDKHGRPYRKKY